MTAIIRRSTPAPLLVALMTCIIAITCPVQAQEDTPQPQTAADPMLPARQLELMVKPLTRDELKVEADAWLALLKSKVREVSEARIVVDVKKTPSPSQTQTPEQTENPQATADEDAQRVREIQRVAELRSQRTALIDRLNIVLAELTLKGGDAEPYNLYVAAVSDQAITVDVQDVSATWIALRAWLTSPDGGLKWLRNLTLFFVTLIASWVFAVVAGRATARIVRTWKKSSALLKDFAVGIVRKTILVIGFILALTFLQININPLLAALGGAAFVVAFALQGTLSNFAAGILILAYRPFDIGDFVDVAGVSGLVDSMSLVSTTIKSPDNKKIIVPNGSIWGGVITNATAHDTRRIDMTFGIGYGDDIDKAHNILEEIVTSHPLVLKDPAPTIKMHELADSSVNFIVRPWSKTADYWAVYWDVQRAVKQRFDDQGISIPFPQRDLHVYQVPATNDA